jgi:hypothetical protein
VKSPNGSRPRTPISHRCANALELSKFFPANVVMIVMSPYVSASRRYPKIFSVVDVIKNMPQLITNIVECISQIFGRRVFVRDFRQQVI